MEQTHGSIVVEDNIAGGTIVTLNAHTSEETPDKEKQSGAQIASAQVPQVQQMQQMQQQQQQPYTQPVYAQPPYATNPYTNAVAETPVYTNLTYTNLANTGHLPTQMPVQQPSMQPAQQVATPGLSERAVCVLRAVCTYGAIGPSELARMFGFSQPTWSRELQALETMGVLHRAAKEQKRTLTQLGQDFVRQHNITPL